MCGKFGSDEVETIENMMSMAVCYVIADTFDLDVDELSLDSNLQTDLGMDDALREKLDASIMDMFNDFQLDFSRVSTVEDVLSQVAKVSIH